MIRPQKSVLAQRAQYTLAYTALAAKTAFPVASALAVPKQSRYNTLSVDHVYRHIKRPRSMLCMPTLCSVPGFFAGA